MREKERKKKAREAVTENSKQSTFLTLFNFFRAEGEGRKVAVHQRAFLVLATMKSPSGH